MSIGTQGSNPGYFSGATAARLTCRRLFLLNSVMETDFHHTVTYVTARLAGFGREDAGTIARSAQYVDDAAATTPTQVTADTLRQAQKEPEKFRDLIVRVAGYSDYFNDLGNELQDEIIRRTEHQGY